MSCPCLRSLRKCWTFCWHITPNKGYAELLLHSRSVGHAHFLLYQSYRNLPNSFLTRLKALSNSRTRWRFLEERNCQAAGCLPLCSAKGTPAAGRARTSHNSSAHSTARCPASPSAPRSPGSAAAYFIERGKKLVVQLYFNQQQFMKQGPERIKQNFRREEKEE